LNRLFEARTLYLFHRASFRQKSKGESLMIRKTMILLAMVAAFGGAASSALARGGAFPYVTQSSDEAWHQARPSASSAVERPSRPDWSWRENEWPDL
jgi:hypothetical protein